MFWILWAIIGFIAYVIIGSKFLTVDRSNLGEYPFWKKVIAFALILPCGPIMWLVALLLILKGDFGI